MADESNSKRPPSKWPLLFQDQRSPGYETIDPLPAKKPSTRQAYRIAATVGIVLLALLVLLSAVSAVFAILSYKNALKTAKNNQNNSPLACVPENRNRISPVERLSDVNAMVPQLRSPSFQENVSKAKEIQRTYNAVRQVFSF